MPESMEVYAYLRIFLGSKNFRSQEEGNTKGDLRAKLSF